MHPALHACLVLGAIASPLFTFARLWQMKEWRTDRLKEHLRANGYLRQLFGVVRPLVFAICVSFVLLKFINEQTAITSALLAFFCLSVVQFATRKQKLPVVTSKTIILIALTVLINAAIILYAPLLSVVLPLVQPLLFGIAWCLFLPIDTISKKRIMQKATRLREAFDDINVIGITGSVGKTTTKELVAHILEGNDTLFTPAYVNSEMGVSNWLIRELSTRDSKKPLTLIVEMGAYRQGEIRRLCSIAKPTIGVITYIGTQHIALFGSQEKLCKAKGELIESLEETGTAIVNGDNELCRQTLEHTKATKITVGTGGHCDIEAYDIEETSTGIAFRVDKTLYSIRIHGTHNVTNCLLAIAACKELGMKEAEIAKKLRSFRPPSSTFSVEERQGVTVVDDTHNASPESFRAAIAWAASQPHANKILVTPGIIELGIDEERIHRELGKASQNIFNEVVFSGSTGKKAFEEGFGSKIKTIASAKNTTKKGDLLICIGRTDKAVIHPLLNS